MAGLPKVVLLSITEEALAGLIEEAVKKAVTNAVGKGQPQTPTQLLTREQLANHFQCSTRHISKLVDRGMPFHGHGRQKRFRLQEAEGWMRSKERQ